MMKKKKKMDFKLIKLSKDSSKRAPNISSIFKEFGNKICLGGLESAEIGEIIDIEVLNWTFSDKFIRINYENKEVPGNKMKKENTTENPRELGFKGMLTRKPRILYGTLVTHQCSKTKQCPDCNGKGELTCNDCKGSGICTKCGGQGQHICSSCHGTGNCHRCHGRGRVTCTQCSGRGWVERGNGETSTCPTCHGKGKIDCPDCHTWKGSNGYCKRCDGSGYENCSKCNGTGKCYYCSGRGVVLCKNCIGTGEIKCTRCNGTGYRQTYRTYVANEDFFEQTYIYPAELETIVSVSQGDTIYNKALEINNNAGTIIEDNIDEALKLVNEHLPNVNVFTESLNTYMSEFVKYAKIGNNECLCKYRNLSAKTRKVKEVQYYFQGEEYYLYVYYGDRIYLSFGNRPTIWSKLKNYLFGNKDSSEIKYNKSSKPSSEKVKKKNLDIKEIHNNQQQMKKVNINFQEENQKILNEWHNASHSNDRDKDSVFVEDGLMYRGDIFYNSDGIWKRHSANESELWSNASPRIMLITKDFNDQEGHTADDELDLRNETMRKNCTGKDNVITSQIRFHTNLMFHVYGLGNYKDGHCPSWEDLQYDTSRKFYETYPLVRINVKKQGGNGSVSDAVISEYIETYKEYLNRQIRLFDADIIVCYGRVIFDYVIRELFPDIKKQDDDPWVYFSEEKQKVVINSYHPSVRPSIISDEHFYSWPMMEFEQMMLLHKDFATKYLKNNLL